MTRAGGLPGPGGPAPRKMAVPWRWSRPWLPLVCGILAALLCQAIGSLAWARPAAGADLPVHEQPLVGVVYPEIREPFRSVFMSIIEGISDALGDEPRLFSLADADGPAQVQAWADASGVGTIIALGSRGPDLSDALGDRHEVIVGAVHLAPGLIDAPYTGIALNPSPALLLERLRTFAPNVRRVIAVYHHERDQWMIDRARESAAGLGIEIDAIPVDRLQDAVNAYREVLRHQHSTIDALWLSQDRAVLDEQAVLPMILKEAWSRRLIVVSTNPAHVRRGVLLALYPDNYHLGMSLGTLVTAAGEPPPAGAGARGVRMLTDVSVALNIRTASHLGLRYPREVLREVNLIFPLM